jgi:hypothetical protein
MPGIATALRDEDIEAVTSYYAGLPVPRPTRASPTPTYAGAQPPTLPGVGLVEGKGSDAEGAAATTGGSQDPAVAASRGGR